MGIAKENSHMTWTKERKQELQDLYRKGLSDKEIALRVGRTRSAVSVQRNKMRLYRRRAKKKEHIKKEDVVSFKLEEDKKYILKNVAANRLTQTNGYLTNKKAKARVIKNYREYIAFEINKRCECIQKIDLIAGNVEYEEI